MTTGSLVRPPREQVVNSNSAVMDGAKMYVYENNTTTPVSLYSDRACTISQANPVIADSAGIFNLPYVATVQLLTVVVKSASDVTLYTENDVDPTVASVATLGSLDGVMEVATKAALKALTAGVVDAVFMRARTTAGDGGHGMFRWDSSNLSSQVTADTSEGIYIAPTSASTGASGAWVRAVNGEYFFEWFGALGDNSNDDTTAIAACNAVALAAGKWSKGSPGKTYKTTTRLALSSAARFDLNGATLKPTLANQINGVEVVSTTTYTATTLGSSAAKGAHQLVVASAANIATGRFLRITWTNATTGNSHYFITRVEDVSGTTITLLDSVPAALNSGWTNSIIPFVPKSDVVVRGKIDGSAAGTSRTITGISKANPAVVTYTGTQVVNGETIFIDSVAGMTEVNRAEFTIANATSTTFELSGINSSAYTTYTSGGTAKPVCHGLYAIYASASDFEIDALSFSAGSGVVTFYEHSNKHVHRIENCGSGTFADFHAFGSTQMDGHVVSIEPTGFGPECNGGVYSTFEAHTGRTGSTGTGGRGVKLAACLHSDFYIHGISNAYFTGVAASNGTDNCTFYGSGVVGSGVRDAGVVGNGVGVWLSNQYNTNNVFYGFAIAGSYDYDIQTGATDTSNVFNGCRFDTTKVSDAGLSKFLGCNAIGGCVVDEYTSSNTWTKRPGATVVVVHAMGGGGGGGGGPKVASSTGASGGGGGGGGAFYQAIFAASELGSTESVTIGAAGTSGAGASSLGAGTDGGTGGNTSFSSGAKLVFAGGGGGGEGGEASAASGGGGGGSTRSGGAVGAGGTGGSASVAGSSGGSGVSATNAATVGGGGGGGGCSNVGVAGTGALSMDGGGGGGAGGGFDASNNEQAGGGGLSNHATTGSTGGVVNGGAGGAGFTGKFRPGFGGAGGGSNVDAVAGAGGAGSYGNGGGGGGASQDGNGGAGGAGGAGLVRVFTYF